VVTQICLLPVLRPALFLAVLKAALLLVVLNPALYNVELVLSSHDSLIECVKANINSRRHG
jgi:hypothetical protein